MSESLTIYYAGSGSWYETFDNKKQYFIREKAHNDFCEYLKKHPYGKLDKEGNELMEKYEAARGKITLANVEKILKYE